MSQKQDSTNKDDAWLADLYNEEKSDKAPLVVENALPENGGPKGLEPTRYGDWEKSGRCIDF